MRSRLLKTTILVAAAGAMRTHMPLVTLRLSIGRWIRPNGDSDSVERIVTELHLNDLPQRAAG